MLCMAQRPFAALLCAAIVFVSCSQPTNVQSVADTGTSALKNRIPPPDPNKYRSVRDGRDWRNPYLIVQANGIDAAPTGAATKAATLSPADTVTYLERLPAGAWPYGLVVVVSEGGLRNPDDNVQITRNREELIRLLEKAGVKVELWPSA
jgi:hypothetical protein